jgi:hypothetical protein
MVAFQRHLYSDNAALSRQKRRAMLFTPAFFIALFVIAYLLTDSSWILVWGGFFIVFYVFLIYRAFRSGLAKRVRQIYSGAKDFFCEHQMEINEEGVTVKTAVSESWISWLGIPKIVSDGDYVFIYTAGKVNAFVISRKGVREGDFDGFVAAAKSFWQEKKKEVFGTNYTNDTKK